MVGWTGSEFDHEPTGIHSGVEPLLGVDGAQTRTGDRKAVPSAVQQDVSCYLGLADHRNGDRVICELGQQLDPDELRDIEIELPVIASIPRALSVFARAGRLLEPRTES